MKIIDISNDLLTAEVYERDPIPEMKRVREISPDSYYNLSVLDACLHNGTHIDAPLHFVPDADSVDKLPLEKFIGPCKVIEVSEGIITGRLVEEYFPRDCKRVLIKSKGSAFIHCTGAEVMSHLGYELVGTDGVTVEVPDSDGSTHRSLLNANIAILEGLNLEDAKSGEYFLIAPPVKIGGAEASFTRAVLISDYIFWSSKNRGEI